MLKKVSIVIPVYNEEPSFLEAAVASALAQTHPDIEVVLVDDGSTRESTLSTLEQLQQNERIRLLHQANQGPSVARNTGVLAASGDYILPLDSDDLIEPEYVRIAYEQMEKNPRLGLVYCLADYIGDKTGPWELPPYRYPDILLGNCIFCTTLFRKEDWLSVGGYKQEMKLGWEDYEFFLSLIEKGFEVYCIPQVLFHYRKHGVSRSTQADTEEGMTFMWGQMLRLHRGLFFKHFCFLKKRKAPLYQTWKNLSFKEKFRLIFNK